MKESSLQTTVAQKYGYISWDVMINSISSDGCNCDDLRNLFESYAIARVLQAKS